MDMIDTKEFAAAAMAPDSHAAAGTCVPQAALHNLTATLCSLQKKTHNAYQPGLSTT